jgi:hypothetical protein
LTEKASDVCDDIETICEAAFDDEDGKVVVFEAGDWLQYTEPEDLGIAAKTTDEELEKIAEQCLAEALDEGVHTLHNLDRELEEMRDSLRDEDED